MNISDEAVEAALDALLEVFQQGANGGVYIQENSATDWVVDGIADLPLAVRRAVEAAAPRIMAQALNDAANAFENLPSKDGSPVAPWDRTTAVVRLRERAMRSTQAPTYHSAGPAE